jgi:hypothetical protein
VVSLTPLWHVQRSHWHHWDIHSGVIDTAVICTAVSLIPLCNPIFMNDTKHCFLCGNMIRLLTEQLWHAHDTAVTCTAESLTPLWKYDTAVTLDLIFEWLWLPLKGISIENSYIGKFTCIHYIYNFHTQNMGVNYFNLRNCKLGTVRLRTGLY